MARVGCQPPRKRSIRLCIRGVWRDLDPSLSLAINLSRCVGGGHACVLAYRGEVWRARLQLPLAYYLDAQAGSFRYSVSDGDSRRARLYSMDHGVRPTVTRHAQPRRDFSGTIVPIEIARAAAAERHADIERQAAEWVERRFPTADALESTRLENVRSAEVAADRASETASSSRTLWITRGCIGLGFTVALAGPFVGGGIASIATGLILVPIAFLADMALRQQIAINRVRLELLKLQTMERSPKVSK
jgi:hypothetical protein